MKRIFGTLKKYWLQIIIVFILLFVQAMCDLSLPDYTSKIINNGISSSGIEDIKFEVISKDTMDKLLIFTNKDDEILSNYTLIKKGNKDYDYEILNKEDIYILNKENKVDNLLDDSLLMYYVLTNEEMLKNMNIDSNTDVFTIFSNMPYESITEILNNVKEKMSNLSGTSLNSIYKNLIKEEYIKVGKDVEKLQINYIINLGIRMILLSLLIVCLTVITTYISSRVGAAFSRDLRKEAMHRIMSYSNKEFDQISTSSLITRATNDITQIQMLIIMTLRIVIYAPIMGLGALSKVSNSPLEWIIGVAILTVLSLIIIVFTLAIPKFKKLQKLIDKINLVSRQILTGIPVIRAFSNEKYEEKKFHDVNLELSKTNLFIGRIMTFMMPTMMFIMYGMQILIIWVASEKVDLGLVQIGDIFAFISYSIQIIMSFLMISMVSIILPRSWVSVKRLAEIFNLETSIKDPIKAKKLKDKKITVEFKDVYFRYPDAVEDIISNINFTAKPGTTTAFIGSTGSGKSTLINLIPRFFDVTNGKILFNGIDIRDLTLKDLRSNIGFVPQKGNLFSGTIESNICFGKKLNKKEVEEIATISMAKEFINSKEKKYDYEISEGGTNVSGGQRQRLSIARAIAINPSIYIFDDSFSALDYKTDTKLRKNLKKITKDATIFIVAQRISTILHADQIVVLEEGKIVGIGNHKELLKNCEVYKEIASSQLSMEELENA